MKIEICWLRNIGPKNEINSLNFAYYFGGDSLSIDVFDFLFKDYVVLEMALAVYNIMWSSKSSIKKRL